MSIRLSRLAAGLLVVAATVLSSDRGWAVYYELGPSQDEWGLKYHVELEPAGADKLTVRFTLADEGRLAPFYSIHLIAFSKTTDRQGGRSYDLKTPVALTTTADGRRTGQVEMSREFLDRAKIRILTLTVDGKRQTSGARYYDIPLEKFVNPVPTAKAPSPRPSIAAPPVPNVRK
jgi:hypothetical protein